MTKRLPQVGEVWFMEDGSKTPALMAWDDPEHPLAGGPESDIGKCLYTKEGVRYCNSHDRPNIVLIHKDATGKVIHATFDPALIGRDEEAMKLYEAWGGDICAGNASPSDRFRETGETRDAQIGEWFVESGGKAHRAACCVTGRRIILTKYNPEDLASQKGTMPTESDPIVKAIAEAEDRAKDLRDLQTKLARAATMQGDLKAMQGDLKTLRLKIAALRAKYPIDDGEPELRSGYVQIVNHEGPAMPDAVTYGFSFEGQPKKPSKTKPKPKAKKAGKRGK